MDEIRTGVGDFFDDVLVPVWDHVTADIDAARPPPTTDAPFVIPNSEQRPLVPLAIGGPGPMELYPEAIPLGFRGRY